MIPTEQLNRAIDSTKPKFSEMRSLVTTDAELIADAKRWAAKATPDGVRLSAFKSKVTGFWMASYHGTTCLYRVVYDSCEGHRTERELWLALGKLLDRLREELET